MLAKRLDQIECFFREPWIPRGLPCRYLKIHNLKPWPGKQRDYGQRRSHSYIWPINVNTAEPISSKFFQMDLT